MSDMTLIQALFWFAHNKLLQGDQNVLSCLLLKQKPRQHILAPEQERYAMRPLLR
jgi:hypothetical protein